MSCSDTRSMLLSQCQSLILKKELYIFLDVECHNVVAILVGLFDD